MHIYIVVEYKAVLFDSKGALIRICGVLIKPLPCQPRVLENMLWTYHDQERLVAMPQWRNNGPDAG